jgi:hypothetical protein
MRVKLIRTCDDGTQTLGRLVAGTKEYKTLELAWKNNERGKSCIPVGTYKVIEHTSPKFGKCYWLQGTEPRQEILIHKGNYHTDIRGCILVGMNFKDINGDGLVDVTESGKAVNELLTYKITEIEIVAHF